MTEEGRRPSALVVSAQGDEGPNHGDVTLCRRLDGTLSLVAENRHDKTQVFLTRSEAVYLAEALLRLTRKGSL